MCNNNSEIVDRMRKKSVIWMKTKSGWNTCTSVGHGRRVCYGTDFAVTASAVYFFYFGVELRYSAVAGSQQLSTLLKLTFIYALAEIWLVNVGKIELTKLSDKDKQQ